MKTFFFGILPIYVILLMTVLYIDYTNLAIEPITIVENKIQIEDEKLLLLAAELNTPEWNDILLEAGEWAVVAGVSYASGSLMTGVALGVKYARTTAKAYKLAKIVKKSYLLLNKITNPFYKALARPFNKYSIALAPERAGIYIFFEKRTGKVKYVGKSVNLKSRLKQHFNGPSNSGNALLYKNASKLAFIAIPIKAFGNHEGAISCVEAIGIKVFNDGNNLYNKRIESINSKDCQQLLY